MTRRPLPFDDPAVARLDGAARQAMARHWRRRAWSEGQVAEAFATLHAGLLEVGAAGVVCGLIGRARDDEVRHSGVCAALAVAYAGAAIAAPAGPASTLPRFEHEARATEVMLQVVGMCCLSETLATVWLEASLAAVATRAEFEGAIEARLDRLNRTARDCIAAAGLGPSSIDTIFLTGGSSRVPAVRAAIARAAPSARLAAGSDLLSVALGLTQMAGAMS